MFALGSFRFYGFLVGGWSSSSKYSLYGSMRAVAQLVSYEVALTMAVIGVVMMPRSLSLTGIVQAQHRDGIWYIVPQFVGFADLHRGLDGGGQPHPVRPARGRG